VMPKPEAIQRVQVANPISEGFEGTVRKRAAAPAKRKGVTVVKDSSAQVGRNDPCPCGSGKKYKNCCLRTQSNG